MLTILINLIRNLLLVDVFVVDKKGEALETLEKEKNALGLSFYFKRMFLNNFIKNSKNNIYYEIVDNLSQRLFLFHFENKVIIVGPYLKKILHEKDIEYMHRDKKLSPEVMEGLKIQYFNCPVLDSYHIEKTLNGIISSLPLKNKHIYTYQRINPSDENIFHEVEYEYDKHFIENNIYKKYEIENDLLFKVENGLVEDLKYSLSSLASTLKEEQLVLLYSTEPQIAMASYRTMLRKAAEKSGISVLIIDKIISNYTQLMLQGSPRDYPHYINELTIEMTTEIRDFLLNIKCKTPIIKNILNYLFLHHNEEITLDKLSKIFNISKYHLSHLFKKETGKTLQEYIENVRMGKAHKLLLTDTSLSISDVALKTGYLDNNYFTKVFKKRYGMTPSKYRNIGIR